MEPETSWLQDANPFREMSESPIWDGNPRDDDLFLIPIPSPALPSMGAQQVPDLATGAVLQVNNVNVCGILAIHCCILIRAKRKQ